MKKKVYLIPNERCLNVEEKQLLREAIQEISCEITSIIIDDKSVSIITGDDDAMINSRIKKTIQVFSDYINYRSTVVYQRDYKYQNNHVINPMKELEDKGLIYKADTGVYLYRGLLADIYECIDKKFETISLELGAKKVIFPSLLHMNTLNLSKYVKAHQDKCEYVLDSTLIQGQPLSLKNITSVLNPAVCQPLYPSFANQVIQEEICTGYSKCFRKENNYPGDLSRLKEYGVRETVYIGTEEKTKVFRDRMLGELTKMMNIMKLSGTIESASDAFFSSNSLAVKMFQLTMNMKYEAKLIIPYKKEKIAVSSVNYHGDHFGKCWNIKTPDGKFAHSCCWGIGIDRLCYAMISQFGFHSPIYRECFGVEI